MTINQSYNESTCNSVQYYNDKSLTIQIDSFENADTIQRKAHIESLAYDDQSSHLVDKIDHSIDLKPLNETSSIEEFSASDLDSLTNKENEICTAHSESCFLRCDNMLSLNTKYKRILCP